MPIQMIVFSSRQYDRDVFIEANAAFGYSLHFQESQLDAQTAILAHGCAVVCPFVNDILDETVLETLREGGTQLVALRSAGFNHVDLAAAVRLRNRRGARAGLFAVRSGGARRRADPDAESQVASRLCQDSRWRLFA